MSIDAKKLVESLKELQEQGVKFPCPRCGHDRMDVNPIRNSLSRYAYVYICNECGTEEAMMDFTGMEPLPFEKWGMALGFNELEEESDEELFDVQKCRVCGCTDNNACEGGCYWVEDDLCSKCAEKLEGE